MLKFWAKFSHYCANFVTHTCKQVWVWNVQPVTQKKKKSCWPKLVCALSFIHLPLCKYSVLFDYLLILLSRKFPQYYRWLMGNISKHSPVGTNDKRCCLRPQAQTITNSNTKSNYFNFSHPPCLRCMDCNHLYNRSKFPWIISESMSNTAQCHLWCHSINFHGLNKMPVCLACPEVILIQWVIP